MNLAKGLSFPALKARNVKAWATEAEMNLVDETSAEPVAVTRFICAVCPDRAIVLKLFPISDLKTGVKVAEDAGGILVISGFIGLVEIGVSVAILPELRKSIDVGDARRLRKLNSEFIPCYCQRCRLNYCIKHWQTALIEDSGLYDCTYGICPRGHRQMIDD